jgi:hypothetical protein
MAVPRSHEDGRKKNRAGQRSLGEVHEQKRKAALKDPGADRNKENLEKAKRGEWK